MTFWSCVYTAYARDDNIYSMISAQTMGYIDRDRKHIYIIYLLDLNMAYIAGHLYRNSGKLFLRR